MPYVMCRMNIQNQRNQASNRGRLVAYIKFAMKEGDAAASVRTVEESYDLV
jgi:hypothetical protein